LNSMQHASVQGPVMTASSAVSATVTSSPAVHAHGSFHAPVVPPSPRAGAASAAAGSGRLAPTRQLLFRGLRLKWVPCNPEAHLCPAELTCNVKNLDNGCSVCGRS
jgi:hypothetical protein